MYLSLPLLLYSVAWLSAFHGNWRFLQHTKIKNNPAREQHNQVPLGLHLFMLLIQQEQPLGVPACLQSPLWGLPAAAQKVPHKIFTSDNRRQCFQNQCYALLLKDCPSHAFETPDQDSGQTVAVATPSPLLTSGKSLHLCASSISFFIIQHL